MSIEFICQAPALFTLEMVNNLVCYQGPKLNYKNIGLLIKFPKTDLSNSALMG
jgi:hypothetical protein